MNLPTTLLEQFPTILANISNPESPLDAPIAINMTQSYIMFLFPDLALLKFIPMHVTLVSFDMN